MKETNNIVQNRSGRVIWRDGTCVREEDKPGLYEMKRAFQICSRITLEELSSSKCMYAHSGRTGIKLKHTS